MLSFSKCVKSKPNLKTPNPVKPKSVWTFNWFRINLIGINSNCKHILMDFLKVELDWLQVDISLFLILIELFYQAFCRILNITIVKRLFSRLPTLEILCMNHFTMQQTAAKRRKVCCRANRYWKHITRWQVKSFSPLRTTAIANNY